VSGSRPQWGREWSRAAIALGVFAAIQTFVFFARRDRFSVLFWWTSESWLLVTLLWCKDLALAAAAFLAFGALAHRTGQMPEPPESESRTTVRHALIFVAILAAGTALRWLAPRQIPPGVWADALFEAEGVLRDPGSAGWLGGRPLQVEGMRNSALVSNLYLKFCELVFSVFRRGDIGLLALSAVGGTLAIPATYWLGREIRGPRLGLLAMALVAFAGWPLVFSRWAWTDALLLPLALGGAAAAIRAYRDGSLFWAALAGLLVGLSLHTYVAAWALAAGFAIFAIGGLRRPKGAKLALVATGTALLAFLPFGLAFLQYPERVGGRAQDVSFLAPTKDVAVPGGNRAYAPPLRLLYNGIEYTGIFLWTRDPNPRHGLPDRPPFHTALGLAALTGAALTVRRASAGDAGNRLLLLLAGSSLLAGILGNPGGAPNGLRIYPFVGVALLWAAAAVDLWIPFAARAMAVRQSLLFGLGLVVLLAVETLPFLAVWPDDGRVVGSFCATETAAGRVRRSLGDAPTVVEVGALAWPIVFETLAAGSDPRKPVGRLPRETPMELLDTPPQAPFWYVTTPDSLERLRKAGWRCSRGVSPADEHGATVISRVIPARLVPAAQE
jgi:hypothetical protein